MNTRAFKRAGTGTLMQIALYSVVFPLVHPGMALWPGQLGLALAMPFGYLFYSWILAGVPLTEEER